MTAGELYKWLEHELTWGGLEWDASIDMLCPTWGYEAIARIDIDPSKKAVTLVPGPEL